MKLIDMKAKALETHFDKGTTQNSRLGGEGVAVTPSRLDWETPNDSTPTGYFGIVR
jgi:hypothetical protein